MESGWRLPGHRWAAVIPVSLGVAVGSLVFFAWLSEEMRERGTDRLDSAVRFAVHQHASPWLTALLSRVTYLGDWPVILAGTCVLLLVCWYCKQRGLLLLVLVTMAGRASLTAR